MNKVIIDDNFMSQANKKYVDQFILGSDYPYYIQENSVENDNHIYMVHTAVTRPEGHDLSNHTHDLTTHVETITRPVHHGLTTHAAWFNRACRIHSNINTFCFNEARRMC